MDPTFPLGSDNIWNLFTGKKAFVDFNNDVYEIYKNEKMVGQYQMREPQLLVMDMEIAKNILIKDFDYFVDRRSIEIPDNSYFNKVFLRMLTNLKGDEWKALRAIVSPIFTSGKLKTMHQLLNKVRAIIVVLHLEKE